MSNRDPNEIVEATIKYNGSLGIAFLWNGEVLVTTKRRMDSEQAIWAQQWINDHCKLTEFQAGYTYMFEIIYQNNTVVVNYPFEGLVLLAITDESGYELPYEEVLHCARIMGFFMVTPRITGSYSEVLWYCGGIERSEETATPNWPPFIFTSGALPVNEGRQEGWVVKFNDGSRQKIVYRWWKDVFKLAGLVHPQIIWLLLKHDKIKEVFGNAPNHFQGEIHRMVQAIGGKFEETLRLVESSLRRPYFRRTNSTKEFSLPTGDSGRNNDRLRQLLNELKPYRHARRHDVNLSPFYHHSKPNFFRLPILKYICPTSPKLEGYEPGDNFKQMWCKGWNSKPLSMIDQWQFVQTVLHRNNSFPLFLQFPVEVYVMILNFLDRASVTALAKVCVYLRQIVKSCITSHLLKKPEKEKNKPALPAFEPWKRYRSTYNTYMT